MPAFNCKHAQSHSSSEQCYSIISVQLFAKLNTSYHGGESQSNNIMS